MTTQLYCAMMAGRRGMAAAMCRRKPLRSSAVPVGFFAALPPGTA